MNWERLRPQCMRKVRTCRPQHAGVTRDEQRGLEATKAERRLIRE
jgi:hypothetical protein